MQLLIFRSLWTTGFDLRAALADCATGVFDGVEGPVPTDATERTAFVADLRAAGVPFIAEVTTGGGYVPDRVSVEEHLADFRRKAELALEATPRSLTVLGGCDRWTLDESARFFSEAIAFAEKCGVAVSFETHRSRATFNPWITARLLTEIPTLRLTCDFSHWCCVCERLVMDHEPGILSLCAERAHHVHARVGYDQGPQVPHPAAPEYHHALEAHERWWNAIWLAREATGAASVTMTPEFGPDGYLQSEPFTRKPVANLNEINGWMAVRLRQRFAQRWEGVCVSR
jgi:hypothetical protein